MTPAPPSSSSFNNPHTRWRALTARDPAAHASFVYAVLSTRIYCRPTCPARLARRANIVFYDAAAQAAAAGFRACKRCRPDVVVIAHAGSNPIGGAAAASNSGNNRVDAAAAATVGGGGEAAGAEQEYGEDTGGRRAAEKARKVLEREGGEVVWRDVAKEVERAPRYLHGVFRAAFGVTPGVYAAGVKKRKREAESVAHGVFVGQEQVVPDLMVDEGSSSSRTPGSELLLDDLGDLDGLLADIPGLGEGGSVEWNEACMIEWMEPDLEPWENLVQWDAFPAHVTQGTGQEQVV
ncbi:Bifunctional transcriptional activator/DNA repair enzyme Ada [Lasiodiplodia hormozganensis]|uniref:Bifunctional transcriptional activator/DNA repair enzyme Ada n=1 Tax=Lasiodiplodia hormozganensis TaxID=869390 RepID=A0AA39TJ53_9PEZI|nr:Bifunctional transcriptional activator/DNA repair enzyme Ada [Lasiodiplodia hormozganensis]